MVDNASGPRHLTLVLAVPVFLCLLPLSHARILQTLCTASPSMSCMQRQRAAPPVPSPLVVAYASWGECDDKIVKAAEQGANVIIWFSIVLESKTSSSTSPPSQPRIGGSVPSTDCVATIAKRIRDSALVRHDVLHMVSIGGWNAPLPDTTHTAETWARVFAQWNAVDRARPDLGWYGFDGIDWDAEGNDDPDNTKNHVSRAHLDLIGRLSQVLKQMGYLVSMAPAQSYLDVENPSFDLSLVHAPVWKSDFEYHGANLYAYPLAFYAQTKTSENQMIDTFDWVGLQLYEGWSRANEAVASRKMAFDEYIEQLVNKMDTGWTVDFGKDYGGKKVVSVSRSRLVIGLANAWTDPYPPVTKFMLVRPVHLGLAWKKVRFAGYMFWTIAEEGRPLDGQPLFLTKELSTIVGVSSTTR